MRYVVLLLAALSLGGCFMTGGSTQSLEPVCDALIGPIRYNTFNKDSARYAGPELGKDLKQRNQVGERLHCEAYR